MNDEQPPPTRGQRALAAAVGTGACLALAIAVLSALDDRTAKPLIGIVPQALIPLPFLFWRWPGLVLSALSKLRR